MTSTTPDDARTLAEEVIRLREEIDRLKRRCRDRALIADAEARLAGAPTAEEEEH